MHINYKINFFTLFFILFVFIGTAFSQININFPVERSVFQRDNNNKGIINISGTVDQDCDYVEVRLIPRIMGQGVETNWQSIKVETFSFHGKIQAEGGWYSLEVRSLKNSTILSQNHLERVGIGEVFIIAGQSNAQGYGQVINAKSSRDDRINAYSPNYFHPYTSDRYEDLPDFFSDLRFEHIEGNTNIGPGGFTAYHYGELGDLLAEKLNVPILFFNAAFTGTSSKNWEESSRKQYTNHEFFYQSWFPLGQPYIALEKTLHSINKILGVRSILWHQGEYDSSIDVNGSTYFNNVKKVIEKTRSDIGINIPWVIARVSLYYGKTNEEIINAQNNLISTLPETWPGPNTDFIQPNRYDGGHFQNVPGDEGLSRLAQEWDLYLNNDFFTNSNPLLASDLISLQYRCYGENIVRFSLQNSYNDYQWSNGQRASETDYYDNGMVDVFVKDSYGNIYRSNSINVEKIFPKIAPNLTTPNGTEACEGTDLLIFADSDSHTVLWNNSMETDTMHVKQSGFYSARFKTKENCMSPWSAGIQAFIYNRPQSIPQISLPEGTRECENTGLKLSVDASSYSVLWSNGSTGDTIRVNESGIYSAKFKNEHNCLSDPGYSPYLELYPNPPKSPIISHPNGLVGCEGLNLNIFVDSDQYSVVWNNEIIGDTLDLKEAGNFYAQYKTENNCYSPRSEIKEVLFIPPPEKPILTLLNSDGYECEGDSIFVTIENPQNSSAIWNIGLTNNQISLNKNLGPVTVKLYNLPGCFSSESDSLDYQFYPSPGIPKIKKAGPYYFHAGSETKEVKYQWLLENQTLAYSLDGFLHLQLNGNYRVIAEKTYTVKNGREINCISAPSSPEYWEDSIHSGFSIYPNPTFNGKFKISSNGETQNVKVKIVDILGREIYKTQIDHLSYPVEIDLGYKNMVGKYFVIIDYLSKSGIFPIFFVK